MYGYCTRVLSRVKVRLSKNKSSDSIPGANDLWPTLWIGKTHSSSSGAFNARLLRLKIGIRSENHAARRERGATNTCPGTFSTRQRDIENNIVFSVFFFPNSSVRRMRGVAMIGVVTRNVSGRYVFYFNFFFFYLHFFFFIKNDNNMSRVQENGSWPCRNTRRIANTCLLARASGPTRKITARRAYVFWRHISQQWNRLRHDDDGGGGGLLVTFIDAFSIFSSGVGVVVGGGGVEQC